MLKAWRVTILAVSLICMLCFVVVPGCSSTPDENGNVADENGNAPDENSNVSDENSNTSDDNDNTADESDLEELSGDEAQAIVAASDSPGSLAQATEVTQNSTGDLGDGDQSDRAKQQFVPDITFGTCPEVTKSGSLLEDAMTLTIDFGEEPCTAVSYESEGEDYTYVCSGSSTGTFSLDPTLVSGGMELTFTEISCNEETLDGTADLSYTMSMTDLELEGDWDLTLTSAGEILTTYGTGTVSYEPELSGCCDVTSIQVFEGQVSYDSYVWEAEMDSILISVEEYYSFIPYGGTLSVDGPDIRRITVTFNENSPVTGEITVSIENGRTFTTNFEELEEYATLLLGEVE